MKKELIIVGGGIGGLCTALALENHGVNVDIYEATAEYRPLGAGLILAPNAMQALENLGIAGAVRSIGGEITETRAVNGSGNLCAKETKTYTTREGMYSTYGIQRGKLQRILIESIDNNSLHMGMECTDIKQTHGRVNIEFNGETRVSANAVVGADGIESTVRESSFPGTHIRRADQIGFRGIPRESISARDDHVLWQVWGQNATLGLVPLQSGYYWYVNHADPPERALNVTEILDQLLAKWSHSLDRVERCIENTPKRDIIKVGYKDVPPLDRWVKDRVALLGDAAHGMSPYLGQGACQAIEDAYVLSNYVDEIKKYQLAYKWYEEARKEKADYLVEHSWQIGQQLSPGGSERGEDVSWDGDSIHELNYSFDSSHT